MNHFCQEFLSPFTWTQKECFVSTLHDTRSAFQTHIHSTTTLQENKSAKCLQPDVAETQHTDWLKQCMILQFWIEMKISTFTQATMITQRGAKHFLVVLWHFFPEHQTCISWSYSGRCVGISTALCCSFFFYRQCKTQRHTRTHLKLTSMTVCRSMTNHAHIKCQHTRCTQNHAITKQSYHNQQTQSKHHLAPMFLECWSKKAFTKMWGNQNGYIPPKKKKSIMQTLTVQKYSVSPTWQPTKRHEHMHV